MWLWPKIQDELIRDVFPNFELVFRTKWAAKWEGVIVPISQSYRISIMLNMPWEDESFHVRPKWPNPRIWVTEPLVKPRKGFAVKDIPHTYPTSDPRYPLPCVFDPRSKQWDYDKPIAKDIIPWVSQWLAAYEGWFATGEWTAGGHEWNQEELNRLKARHQRHDQRAQASKHLSYKVGQKIGTFASYPLLVAASEGSIRPMSWQDWNKNSEAKDALRTTLTLLPERRPGGLSP